ncbi:MAG: VWA domain-containing protein [Candidatus Acidiferrales bacterium]
MAICRAQAARALIEPRALAARTDLVRVDVSVLDKHGKFASGLDRNDFRVLDDGVERPIVFFTPVEAPARVQVMIETSPAVYLIHDQHLAAAFALLQGLDSTDQVALVTYSDRPREVVGFTTNKSELLQALNSLQYSIGMGELNFYDALSSVVEGLGPAAGKTAVVLLTTGLDSSQVSNWQPLVRKLRGTDIVIFSVALGGDLRGDESAKSKRKKHAANAGSQAPEAADALGHLQGFARADRALRLLARITGGRAYFPQSDKEFVPIYQEIAAALRHQYVLGVAPAHDGKFHSLAVEVFPDGTANSKQPPKKSRYRVFAREGYIAPAN